MCEIVAVGPTRWWPKEEVMQMEVVVDLQYAVSRQPAQAGTTSGRPPELS